MRSRSALAGVVQCLCLLGKTAVLQGFLPVPPAQSVGPARSAAVFRHASSLARTELATRSGSRRWRSGAPLGGRAPTLSMASSPPGKGGSSGVGGAIAKSWVGLLLCVASVLGPDVLMQQGQGQGLPTSPRPPLASALSEEQVRATYAWCDGKSIRVLVARGKSFVGVLGYGNTGLHMRVIRWRQGRWLHRLSDGIFVDTLVLAAVVHAVWVNSWSWCLAVNAAVR